MSTSTEGGPSPAAGSSVRGSRGGRAALVTVDQGLSSVTNLLALIWVAHTGTAVEFGSFSLIILVYTLVVGLTQAMISMPVVVHPDDADHRPRHVMGSAVAMALPMGLVCVAVGALQVVVGWSMGPALLGLGLTLPALAMHDVGRAIAIGRGAPVGAVVLDATWLAVLVLSFVAIDVLDIASLFTLTVAWAGSGAVASLYVLVQHGLFRAGDVSTRWLRERWSQSWRLLVGNLTGTGSALVGASLIAFVSSPVAVAAVRAAMLLGRPTSAVQLAVASSAAADIAREKPDRRGLLRHQRRTMAISAVVALVNMAVLLALPDALGRDVLGNVWPVVAPLMLPVTLWLVVAAAQSGVPPALMGRHQFHIAMIVQVVGGVLSVGSLVVGGAVGDSAGAVWGLVVGQGLMAAAWWCGLIWYLRTDERKPRGLHAAPRRQGA